MTKSEKHELSLDFDAKDQASVFDYEFSGSGAIYMTDAAGNRTAMSFHPEHIPAIEQLLTILYTYRGDYDDVIRPQVAELVAA
jgi:hypothetical protein